ncbi:MAG: hypothetical protein GY851_26530 [bacterium]|nr:hypothetical protein [bacterium]
MSESDPEAGVTIIDGTQTDGRADLYSVPDEKAAPKPGKTPAHIETPVNLADDDEIAKKAWRRCKSLFDKFSNQPQREQFERDLVEWDRMYRMSEKRPDSRDEMKTVSNVTDSGFQRRVKTVHTQEVSVLIPDEDMPARYDVEEDTDVYDHDQGEAIVRHQNLLARYTYERDGHKEKIKELNWRTKKNANSVVAVEWERIVEERMQRVPTGRDEDGNPNKFSFKKVKTVVKDCPTTRVKDIRNVYWDTTIEDQQFSPFIERSQDAPSTLYRQQAQGELMNVGKARLSKHGYLDEGESEVLADRQESSGEDQHESEPNGLFDRWDMWNWLPINDDGKWDEENTLPRLFWCTFVGRIDGEAIAVRIIENPYFHGLHPYKVIYHERDDKGGIHMGLGTSLKCLFWQANINLNQSFDNVNLRNRAPMTLQGTTYTRDLTANSNKVIRLGFGAELKRMEIPDTTQITMQMHDRIEDIMDKTANTRKPISGEGLGSRASATESKNVHDEAVKPTLEGTDYFAEQLFPWQYFLQAELWRQMGDPKRKLKILGTEVDPTQLWGPYRIKVTVVTDFATNTLSRQQMGAFLAQNFQQFLPLMTPGGAKLVGQKAMKMMGFEDTAYIFGPSDIGDSVRVAREESAKMLMEGIEDQPQPDENHQIHIQEHKSWRDEFAILVQSDERSDLDPDRLRLLDAHILAHEQLLEAANQQAQAPGQIQPAAAIDTPSDFVGTNTGQEISREEGGLNAGATV